MAGIDKKLTDLTELSNPTDNAWIHVVEPDDISQNAAGSSYKVKKGNINPDATVVSKGKVKLAGDFDISSTADLPRIKDATTTVKGKIKLAGDFDPTSTADVPIIKDATTTDRGVVNTGTQRFKGVKSFSDAVLIGTDTNNGVDKLQVNGSALTNGFRFTNGISKEGIDLNTIVEGGLYYSLNGANAPANTVWGTLNVYRAYNADLVTQEFTPIFGGTATGRKYIRNCVFGSWASWSEILTSDTIGKIIKTRKDVTGTSYTLLSSDVDKILYTTNASPVTITVPSGLTTNQEYEVIQYGDGLVSYITSGTTLRYQDYEISSHYAKYSRVTITYTDTETYQLLGQLKMI